MNRNKVIMLIFKVKSIMKYLDNYKNTKFREDETKKRQFYVPYEYPYAKKMNDEA